jgi:thiol-disulfide isomerase/thioredoxin
MAHPQSDFLIGRRLLLAAAPAFFAAPALAKLGPELLTGTMARFSAAAEPKPLPELAFTDADDKPLSLADYKGKALLVNFWATWCDPCREEFPDLVKIDADYRSRGLDFVAISLDELSDMKTSVPKFLRSQRATMPVFLLNVPDQGAVIELVDPAWQGNLPATFLYDQSGKVVYKRMGPVKAAELRAELDKLVGVKP